MNWETDEKSYSIKPEFEQAFRDIIEKQYSESTSLPGIDIARAKEVISYGRTDFNSLHGLKADDYTLLFNFHEMRKQYSAAMAMYEDCGNWLREAIRNVSGRVVFCDISYESAASGLAFIDLCRQLNHTDIYYLGIYPTEEMGQASERFLTSENYRHVKWSLYPRITAVSDGFWKSHSILPELVIFNMSNIMGSISPLEARHLAMHINQLVHARPTNHYITIYRDDTGNMANRNAYMAFCSHLGREFISLNEQMPMIAKYYLGKNTNIPEYKEFIYEIKSNR